MVSSHSCLCFRDGRKWKWPFWSHQIRYNLVRLEWNYFFPRSNCTRHTKIQKVFVEFLCVCVRASVWRHWNHIPRDVIPSWTIYSRTLNENLYQLNWKNGIHKSNVYVYVQFKCDSNRLQFLFRFSEMLYVHLETDAIYNWMGITEKKSFGRRRRLAFVGWKTLSFFFGGRKQSANKWL